jgi:DNA-binding LacI/PurR family transcriptional regulator
MDVTGHTSGHGAPVAGQARIRENRPVSIRDVAAAASVSYQTVSRVINNHPNVRESTRATVLAAIAELGFRPNRAARSLAGGPVHAVTVLTSNTTRYGYAATLQGIEEAARANGFAMGIRVLEPEGPELIADAVHRAVEPATALIVIAYDSAGTRALSAVPPAVPLAAAVETPSGTEADGRPWVWLDDRRAAYEATAYLLGLGHRTVHYVAIPASTATSPRMAGWRAALTAASVEVPDPSGAGWTPQAGYEAGRRLADDPSVTAVLCGNDDLAVGVMRAMNEAGRDIPGSVSVIGFDDTPNSAFLSPALSTVRLDWVALGRACFSQLHSLVNPGPPAPPSPPVRPELVVRESSWPPPVARTARTRPRR